LILHNCAEYDHSWRGKVLRLHDADGKVIMMILLIMVSHYELDIHVGLLQENCGAADRTVCMIRLGQLFDLCLHDPDDDVIMITAA
jgi:hypothetical protein